MPTIFANSGGDGTKVCVFALSKVILFMQLKHINVTASVMQSHSLIYSWCLFIAYRLSYGKTEEV